MNLDKAIQRLAFRFTSNIAFKPNLNDVEAVNSIITWVNLQKEKSIANNRLFTKLYIFNLKQKIDEYETTVLDDIPQKQLSKILSTPLDLFYLAFKKQLDMTIIDRVFKGEMGLNLRDLKDMNEEEKEIVSKYTKEEIAEFISDRYDLLEVENKLKNMASEALNRFSNYD